MRALEPNSPVPLYAQLAERLRGRIARGVWTEGDRLPSLEELTREFEVARVTVRQAIILLEREGILAAKQGRGTFVTARPGAGRKLPVQSTLADLVTMLQGSRPRLLNIEERKAAPVLTEQDGKPAEHYVYMRRVHLRDDVPYCVISIYLDERVFRKAPKRFRQEVMIPILVALPNVRIATANQTLTIGTADMETARRLNIPENSPVAEVRRVFRAPDRTVIYLGEVTYRGDLIQIEMDLTP